MGGGDLSPSGEEEEGGRRSVVHTIMSFLVLWYRLNKNPVGHSATD